MSKLRLLRGQLPYLFLVLLLAGLASVAREISFFRQWEWLALDGFLRMRPNEEIDDRIVIVGVEETNIDKKINKFPDRSLAETIERLAAAKASVIGVNFIRDGQIDNRLRDAYQNIPQTIGIFKEHEPQSLSPPEGLPADRAGFVDLDPDSDSILRRVALSYPGSPPVHSFAWKVTQQYLRNNYPAIAARVSLTDDRLQLNRRSISPLTTANNPTGRLVEEDGFEMIVNYRNIRPTFKTLTVSEVLNDPPADLAKKVGGKIVLISNAAISGGDLYNTGVLPDARQSNDNMYLTGSIYSGVLHGHVISQLISTAVEDRSLIQALSIWDDFLWTFGIILFGSIFLRILPTRFYRFQLIGIILFIYIILISFLAWLLLLAGWWVSIFTTSLLSTVNVLILLSSSSHERKLKLVAEIQTQAIEKHYQELHKKTTHKMAMLINRIQQKDIEFSDVLISLVSINKEIREISESLKNDVRFKKWQKNDSSSIRKIVPLERLLEDGYGRAMRENMKLGSTSAESDLKDLKDFEPFPHKVYLNEDLKEEIVCFLEEAINNVYKHAGYVTLLEVYGKYEGNTYRLIVQDNGTGNGDISEQSTHEGTKSAKRLARRLGGKFARQSVDPHGTICTLEWPVDWLSQIWLRLKEEE
jgi:CHASE2 domain-containing sensor protein